MHMHGNLRYIIEECCQWFETVIAEMVELYHHLLLQFIVDGGHREGTRLVRQEVAIVCALQVKL